MNEFQLEGVPNGFTLALLCQTQKAWYIKFCWLRINISISYTVRTISLLDYCSYTGNASYQWSKASLKIVRFPLGPHLLKYQIFVLLFLLLQNVSAMLCHMSGIFPSLEEAAQHIWEHLQCKIAGRHEIGSLPSFLIVRWSSRRLKVSLWRLRLELNRVQASLGRVSYNWSCSLCRLTSLISDCTAQ